MKWYGILLLLLVGCRTEPDLERLLLSEIRQDIQYVAQLEASYGLVFIHHQPNRIISDDFYIREDMVRVSYGYPFEDIKIEIRDDLLVVRLPKPRKISVDRKVKGIRLTHPNYKPLDENGKPIDIEAVMVSKLNEIEIHYEQRTVAMTRNLSRQYFAALAHRHGLKLKLTFAD